MPDEIRIIQPIVHAYAAYNKPWHLDAHRWRDQWGHSGAGEGILVGVGDTGIDETHTEFGDNQIVDAKDFTRSSSSHHDRHGHGTHVASIIAGRTVGVAPKCGLLIAKCLGDGGGGRNVDVAAAIRWLADRGSNIINLSLGSPFPDQAILDAIIYAVEKGCLVFAASGNEGVNRSGFPAGHDTYVFSIGAVREDKSLAAFSNTGESLDFVDFGMQIYAARAGGGYVEMSGTSMSSPMLSGAIANRLSAELKHAGRIQTRTVEDVLNLSGSFEDLGQEGPDTRHGHGIPIASRLVRDGLGSGPQPPPDPPQPNGDFGELTVTFKKAKVG